MDRYELFEENMQLELKQYINQLTDDLYKYNEELLKIIPNDENYEELCYSNSELLEELYDEINDYVNVRTDQIFAYNNNSTTSRQCKLMIMSIYYEYCTVYYQELDKINQQVYNILAPNPTSNHSIEIYDTYYRYILEIYDMYLGFYYNIPYEIDKMRSIILDRSEYKNVINIDTFAIFRYRFLKGIKFDGENIKSIEVGKNLIEIVKKIIGNLELKDNEIINQIQLLLEENDGIRLYVDGYKDYIISNIYEVINSRKKTIVSEINFLNQIETQDRDELLNSLSLENKRLSILLYSFYYYNKDVISEKRIIQLRKITKRKKKLNLVKKYNPFYIEETKYFENLGE